MNFKRYSSIENSYRKKFLDKIRNEGHGGHTYAVQEKVHGSSFAFYITEGDIRCAKRSSFLGKKDSFFSFQSVYNKYETNLFHLFGSIRDESPDTEEVVVFGELCGGSYPHPEVPKLSEFKAVQKGVYYTNRVDFIGFDIKVNGQYLPVDEVYMHLKLAGIPAVKTLFTGTLEECLEYPNDFQSKAHLEFGIHHEIEGNICEGTVIRPVQNNVYLWDRSRVILKNKNERFAEKQKAPKELRPKKEISPEIQCHIEKSSEYITEARLRNVLSKLGPITQKEFSMLMKEYSSDVIEDFLKDYGDTYSKLEKQGQREVTKAIGSKSASLIRPNFQNIVDGEY